jgi:hypothetical protein
MDLNLNRNQISADKLQTNRINQIKVAAKLRTTDLSFQPGATGSILWRVPAGRTTERGDAGVGSVGVLIGAAGCADGGADFTVKHAPSSPRNSTSLRLPDFSRTAA